MAKTFKLLVVNEADPTDVQLERTGIPESALNEIRGKLPFLDGWIAAAKKKAIGAPSAFASFLGAKKLS